MSDDTTVIADPFSSTALDEETELRALTQALEFSEGFKLIFVRCNQPQQRRRLIEILRTRLPQQNISEIHLNERVTHLLDALRERLPAQVPDALFVSGLEYSLPVAAEAHTTPFVANLNASRNSFPQAITYPLVLWIPEYVLNAIILAAPDFFSIRSGVYFFAAAPEDTVEIAGSLTSGAEVTLYDLTPAEKRERIRAIENLLADYEALPPEQRDLHAEMRLYLRRGNLLGMLGSYDAAKHTFQQVLLLANELNNQLYEGFALGSIGNIHHNKGELSEAEAAYQKSLEIFRGIDAHQSEATVLFNLGILYFDLSRWEDAKKAYQQSLEIRHKLGDRAAEGFSINSLARVFVEQGQFSEAEGMYKQSLDIAREQNSHFLEGVSLFNLGILYEEQGRLSEAESAYKQALEIFRRLNDQERIWKLLHNLAVLREAQWDIRGAIDFEKQVVEILEARGDKQELEEERELLADLEAKAKEEGQPER